MPSDLRYSIVVCTRCRRVALLADDSDDGRCAACGAEVLFLPGPRFAHRDLPLFADLERIVHAAELSRGEAALVAADLESVSGRWEPPDLVLAQLSHRLPGLGAVYDSKQDYSQLLLVVSMLLTIVGARLALGTVAPNRSLRPISDIRELASGGSVPRERLARK